LSGECHDVEGDHGTDAASSNANECSVKKRDGFALGRRRKQEKPREDKEPTNNERGGAAAGGAQNGIGNKWTDNDGQGWRGSSWLSSNGVNCADLRRLEMAGDGYTTTFPSEREPRVSTRTYRKARLPNTSENRPAILTGVNI
jgi:hypothetical protein